MTYAYAGLYVEEFVSQNTTSKSLIVPTSAAVYLTGTTTLATLFTDRTMAATAGNPLPTGVTVNTPGIDTIGNIRFYVVPGTYDLLINGTTKITVNVWPDPADLAQLSASSTQALQDWVNAQIVAATSID